MMRVLPLLAVLATADASFARQARSSLTPGTSAISGVVMDALSNEPVKGCMVTVSHIVNFRPASGGVITSDANGTYSFNNIAEGEYAVTASCDRHLSSCYRIPGTNPPRCDTVSVFVDQRKSNIDFIFMPGATASGRVVDANGRPIPKAAVRLGTPLRDMYYTVTRSTNTGVDGSFELSNLPAGEWRLEVDVPAASDAPRPPIIYFPGVLDQSNSGSIELVAGKRLDNILVVAPPIADNLLTVRLVTPEQEPSQVDVSLVRASPLLSRRVLVDADGTGTVNGLGPGRYFLTARGYSGDRVSIAYDVVDFLGDSQEVLLYLQPAARITGKIIGDKGTAPSLDGVRVGASWIHDGVEINPLAVDETPVAVDGTFRLEGLFGTRQLRLFGLDPAFEVRAITQERSDVTLAGVFLAAGKEANVVIVVGRR
jgi:hypothetical protein